MKPWTVWISQSTVFDCLFLPNSHLYSFTFFSGDLSEIHYLPGKLMIINKKILHIIIFFFILYMFLTFFSSYLAPYFSFSVECDVLFLKLQIKTVHE